MTEAFEHSVSLASVSKALGGNPILRNLTLQIPVGQRVALIGPSGAGKTTLLRLLAGVLGPDEGEARVLGHSLADLYGRELKALRREVGLLYQLDNLIPSLRVVHNVLMGNLGRWGVTTSLTSLLVPRDLGRAKSALARVELEHKLWALPGELSGGEQQRVAVARLLVQDPSLMLADEPVSSLDVRLGREIIQLLCSVAREGQRTLVVSLHALDLLGPHFDRVLALRNGELVWDGKPNQISQSMLQHVYGAEYESLSLAEVAVGAAGA